VGPVTKLVEASTEVGNRLGVVLAKFAVPTAVT